MKNHYVVVCPENGWDCIEAVYLAERENQVRKHFLDANNLEDEDWEPYHIIKISTITEI